MIQKTKHAAARTGLTRPIVAIPCDIKMMGVHPFHAVGEKYIKAVNEGAGCLPILIPVMPDPLALEEIFAVADGVFLTGSWSNVHPRHYDGPASREGTLHDEQRDALTLPLIKACIERGMPLFAVCRGFQELNVAFGGTLHQHIHEEPSEEGYAPRFDHRDKKDDPVEVQYGPAHKVSTVPGGFLAGLTGEREITVNSLHGQGIDRLGEGLEIDARAPDGTIEAVRVKEASAFAYAVQWHPEWMFWDNPVSLKLFHAFGEAVRGHAGAADDEETKNQVTHA
ncbi:peptidase C26 [Tepidicaulis marinus]|uniref:gamma-glutamyl-gamma-aminobutyrate hydrolase n=1 Tax=Tepidicaulis marinus TaxID=1333998 RepID=A0A081B6K6_9HYPH|nr:gamma-glutamyl-gamma-aminobutyrate hydrolase family protein [Tepidicaulis marinus]GAK43674.1 peptidase C26 [Tepidicaulis marinus]